MGTEKSVSVEIEISSWDGQVAKAQVAYKCVPSSEQMSDQRPTLLIIPPDCARQDASATIKSEIESFTVKNPMVKEGEPQEFEFEVNNASMVKIKQDGKVLAFVQAIAPVTPAAFHRPRHGEAYALPLTEQQPQPPYPADDPPPKKVDPQISEKWMLFDYRGSWTLQLPKAVWNSGDTEKDTSAEIEACSPSGDVATATVAYKILPPDGTAVSAGPTVIKDFRVTNEPVCLGTPAQYWIDIEGAVSAAILEGEEVITPVELKSSLKSAPAEPGIYPAGFNGGTNGKPSKIIWRFAGQPEGDTWSFPATLEITDKDGASLTKTIMVKVGPCPPPVTAAACPANCDCLTEKEAIDLGYTVLGSMEPCSAPGEPQKFCYSRCPEGCSCVTEKEADEQGYTISCSDEKCDPTSKEAKYCFSPPVQPCSQRCQCLTQAQSKEYGLSDAKRCQTTPCKQDAQGRDMYCYPKSKAPLVDVTADRSFVTQGDPVRVCWKVTGVADKITFAAAGEEPTSVDPQGCKTFRPTQQTRYLVTAKSPAGSGQDSVTVGVDQPPEEICPAINSFTANCETAPTPVGPGVVAPREQWAAQSCPTCCSVSWSVIGPAGTTVSISGIGNVGMSGSAQAQRDATYTLTARYGTCVRTATVQAR